MNFLSRLWIGLWKAPFYHMLFLSFCLYLCLLSFILSIFFLYKNNNLLKENIIRECVFMRFATCVCVYLCCQQADMLRASFVSPLSVSYIAWLHAICYVLPASRLTAQKIVECWWLYDTLFLLLLSLLDKIMEHKNTKEIIRLFIEGLLSFPLASMW